MKIKSIIAVLICFIFSSYSYGKKIDQTTNSVLFNTASYIQKQCGLQLYGFGGGAVEGVARMSLDFSTSKKLTVDETRRLLVECVEIFLNQINSDKKIRPLLVEYPFPPSRISFAIFIHKGVRDDERIPGDLIWCSLERGIVGYRILRERTSFITIDSGIDYKETYEEAKRIVENEKKL